MQKSGAECLLFPFQAENKGRGGKGVHDFSSTTPLLFLFTPLSQALFSLLHQHNRSMLYSLTHFALTTLPPTLFLPTPSFPSFSVFLFLSFFLSFFLFFSFLFFLYTFPPRSLTPKNNKGGGGEGGLSTKQSRGDKLAVRHIQLRADKPNSSRPRLSDQSPTLTSTHDILIKRY